MTLVILHNEEELQLEVMRQGIAKGYHETSTHMLPLLKEGQGQWLSMSLLMNKIFQGGELSSLYRNMNRGEAFINVPVPKENEPEPSTAPVYKPENEKKMPSPNNAIGTYILIKEIEVILTWECGGCGALSPF